MKLKAGNIYKLIDNSVRVKVIVPSADPEYAACALFTKVARDFYHRGALVKTGEYVTGFDMKRFFPVRSHN